MLEIFLNILLTFAKMKSVAYTDSMSFKMSNPLDVSMID